MAHPPRSKPPLRSSSGPPNPCITPSTETLVVVVNLMGSSFSEWGADVACFTYVMCFSRGVRPVGRPGA